MVGFKLTAPNGPVGVWRGRSYICRTSFKNSSRVKEILTASQPGALAAAAAAGERKCRGDAHEVAVRPEVWRNRGLRRCVGVWSVPVSRWGVTVSETSFGELGGSLGALTEQQSDLEAAVKSGQLWMEAGVAEHAATRCEQAADEIDEWLADTNELVQRRKFGDNEDGEAAAARYATAGQEYVQVMTEAGDVFRRMADTYRAAGRTAAEADQASEQLLGSAES